ncbi:GntR family transcriptional regulator [Microvirga rosea]|uniref:GntR family transcriptional regulator n=1 Tax=Microvirga rosea TaxID=2715425 RepID=UPI001D0A7D3B|nr:GntR family transcriptional regulator [Microvirga rosea]MCB8821434.1 GntR family transcriptional regulator [Microvirga rosea]
MTLSLVFLPIDILVYSIAALSSADRKIALTGDTVMKTPIERAARRARRVYAGKAGSKQPRSPTASAIIRQNLRDEILALRLLPGQSLNEKEIADSYGVSRTPVREAILRLAEEGLIDIFPQSGTYVSRIPMHALPEALIIRSALEEASARMAASRANLNDIVSLEGVMRRMQTSAAQNDYEAFHQDDDLFHATIADAAGYPGLWRVAQQVKVQVDRYRRLTLPQEGRFDRVLEEHNRVFKAIRSNDPDLAADEMRRHLSALMADIGDVANLNPDFFD